MNLISANQSQQDFSTQQRIFQPSQTWFHSFIRLSCKLFRLSKAIWSVVNARSKQATRRHHLDRQTRSGSRQYTPTQKKPCIFGAIFNQISLPDIASCCCMTLFWLPCLFPPNCGFDADKSGDYQDSILPKGGNHLNSAGNLLTSQFVADTAKNKYFFQSIGVRGASSFFLATSVISKIHRRPKRVLVYLVGSLFVTIGGFFKGKLWNDHSFSSILMYLNTRPNFDIFLLKRFYRRKRWK